MTPATGWQIRHTDAPFDPWVASNLDTEQTVFGRDRAEVEQQIEGYETQLFADVRWQVQAGVL
jgi:hypothetical protein